MNRTTKSLLLGLAVAGLATGTAARLHAASPVTTGAGSVLQAADSDSHSCKGQNTCKGKGGCKTGDNGCKGKNSCKGKGGCKSAS
ncbi:MAG TPA: hypothetical protein VIM58_11080 [Candidatus Methylacidiphilales bacterium]